MRWFVLALLFGCASPWSPAGPMLREARNNDLAASAKYRSMELRLTGIVVSTGEKKIEHGADRTQGRWVEAPSEEADAAHLFVQIRDAEHPSPYVVTCYFTQRDPAVTQLARGATVRIHGFMVEFAASAGHIDAVLKHCSLE